MSEFNCAKWDTVIIEWVNCLQISKNIASIADLKDWEFFSNVIDLIQPDLKTNLQDFLHAHYPNLILPESGCDYDNNHLILAASLLLHYLCLYDRRDSLINPLCTKLSNNVQMCIKMFLELVTPTLDYEEFEAIIKKSVLYEFAPSTPNKSLEWSAFSSHMQNSPLQEYFKTPAAKSGKLQEKDREIKRLEKELALERYEKDDLYAEINEQKDRIKKISQEVQDKSALITNLSLRLSELEETSPVAHSQEVFEIEKLLRKELTESQIHLATLQKEYDEILSRNEEVSNQLSVAESTASTWQAKAANCETAFDDISNKYRVQQEELANLRMNYNEMQVLLEELRESKENITNSDLETSITSAEAAPVNEVAATVVEIQLKECHAEISDLQRKILSHKSNADQVEEELRSALSELETSRASKLEIDAKWQEAECKLQEYLATNQQLSSNIAEMSKTTSHLRDANLQLEESLKGHIQQSQDLEDELHAAKVQFEQISIAHHGLQESNEEIQAQIADLTESRNELDAKNKELFTSLENLRIASSLKDEELDACKRQLEERDITIADSNDIADNLNKKLDELRCKHNELSELMNSKSTFLQHLEAESRSLQSKYENTLEKYTETNFAFEAIKVEYKRSDDNFQNNINRLEQIVSGSIESAQEEKHTRFSRLLQKLCSKHTTFESTIDCNKKVNEELEKQIIKMQECEHANAIRVKDLQSTLEETEKIVKSFESEIQAKNKQIEENRALISSIEESRTQFEELKVAHISKEKEALEYKSHVAELSNQLNSANQELSQRADAKSQLEEEINKLQLLQSSQKMELQEYLARLEISEKLNNELTANSCLLSKDLGDILQRFEFSQKQLVQKSSESEDLSKKVSELQEKLEHLEETQVATLADKLKHVEKLNANIHELQVANHQFSAEMQKIVAQRNSYRDDNISLRSHIDSLQADVHETEENINIMQMELAKSQTEMEDHKRSIQELMTEVDVQLQKLREKDIELACTKQLLANRDFEQITTINELNEKIEELEASKEQIGNELLRLKESFGIKQMESQAVLESKEKVEKQLLDKLDRHEKKTDVLTLTVNNLEDKMKAISEAKAHLQNQLAHTSGELEIIQKERNQIMEDSSVLQTDLDAVRKALQAKERECANRDQVVDKSNQELCALRLEMTAKQQDISKLKDVMKDLEEEKSESEQAMYSMRKELQALHAKYKKTDEDLQAIINIKATLSDKVDLYKSNIATVLQHFGIKHINLKESVDALMSFKTHKEAEVGKLNERINGLREELQRTKSEEVSMKKDLCAKITAKEKLLGALEKERGDLKMTEANCLQEIERLKKELSYTVEKYTDALQVEKDVKSEHEAQIRTLTESVYEVLEKYNQLDQDHKQLLNELTCNTNSVTQLKSEKESLELDIVQLKCEYDRDSACCKEEFQIELSSMRQIEANLREEIEHLKATLITSNQSEFQLENELCDAKTQLHVIQDEQDELQKKLQSLESTYSELQQDYNNLEIANEKYMKESKAGLIRTQDALQAQISALNAIIDSKDAENKDTHKKVRELTNRLSKEEETFRNDTEARQKQIKLMQDEVAGYKRNVETLKTEKESLTQKLHAQQANFNRQVLATKESNGKVSELETKIRNLEISKDVLEAGRQKLERLHESMLQKVSDWECKHKQAEKDHEATKNGLIKQLQQAKETIDCNKEIIKEKSLQIESANDEFDTVQMILTEMSKKMDSSTRELNVIHENYEGKLKAELDAFSKLRDQFHSTNQELRYMTKLNQEMKQELQKLRQERDGVAELMSEKEKLVSELRAKYDKVAVLIDAKDATIASLQAELAVRLEQLESAAKQRHAVEDEHRCTKHQLELIRQEQEELIRKHDGCQRDNAENLLFLHKSIKALIQELRICEGREKCDKTKIGEIQKFMDSEHAAKQRLEMHIEELRASVHDANTVKKKLRNNLMRFAALLQEKDEVDELQLDELIVDTEQRIVDIFAKLRQLQAACDAATQDKNNADTTLSSLMEYNRELCEEKSQLIQSYEKLKSEKEILNQEKCQASKNLVQIESLYEDLKRQQLPAKLLEEKIADFEQRNKQKQSNYCTFIQRTKYIFKEIDLMIKERNQIDQIVCHLQENFVTLQIKSSLITEDRHKLFYDQKCAVEVIGDDIYKQFRRVSKIIYNFNLKCHAEVEHSINAVVNDNFIDWQAMYHELNGEEIREKLEDLKENSINALEQLKMFIATIDTLPGKEETSKVLKENVQQSLKGRDDDWKKKYLSVKQKLTLTENAKNNFERKLKELRAENKKYEKLSSEGGKQDVAHLNIPNGNVDFYKKLQKDHVQDSTALIAAQREIDELKKQISIATASHNDCTLTFSKLQQEKADLQKAIQEMSMQNTEKVETSKSLSQLCEENSKLQSEIDTLKYKRTRDREEFVKQIKQNETELNQKMQTIKSEYDLKVDKFKSKILSKYKEQVEQSESNNVDKLVMVKEENNQYKSMISKLRDELAVAQAKVEILDSEKHLALQQLRLKESDFKAPAKLTRQLSSQSLHDNVIATEQRRATLTTVRRNAQSMDIIEEVRYRRTSITPSTGPSKDLQMEDEDEMFNTKYLHELKSGGRQNTWQYTDTSNSRLSEFAYRNSLCPPHLKSSYPAETQFIDSRRFKEDDLRSGNIDLDDSMKTHLLPHEKPKKKDIGTTSYKRPGPPTPSKHGARLSLQGNDRPSREVLQNEPKKTTPNPLRSLFSRSKDVTSENAASPKKRTIFFRR